MSSHRTTMLFLICLLFGHNCPERYASAFKASLYRQHLMVRSSSNNKNLQQQQHRGHTHVNENSNSRRIPSTTHILFYPVPYAITESNHHYNRHQPSYNARAEQGSSSTSLSVSFLNDNNLDQNDDRQDDTTNDVSSSSPPSPLVQYLTLGISLFSLSTFILVNRFVGPWPISFLEALSEPYWLLLHYLSGTLFAGTICVSAILENMVVNSSNSSSSKQIIINKDQLLQYWFHQVPQMDAKLVLPSIVTLLVSGTATSHYRYGSLALAPKHITLMFVHLVAFLVWWALTDITTQTKVLEWYNNTNNNDEEQRKDADAGTGTGTTGLQQILKWRKMSNVGSCLFLLALFAIMTLKPGTTIL